MKRNDWILAAISVGLAGLAYAFVGSPGMADRPLSARDAELAAKDPAQMTPDEAVVRLEGLAQARPDDPQPHYFLGEIKAGQGLDEDAIRHYQSALRRNGEFVPAMIGLADAFVRLSEGRVEADARRIYARALQLSPGELRAGFMTGLADWQAGQPEQAQQAWDGIRSRIEPGSSQMQMFDAWIAAARESGIKAE